MLFGATPHTNHLGPNTRWTGHLSARSDVELATPFEGSVQSNGHVLVRRDFLINADITAGSLTIEPGAWYRGRLRVGRIARTET